MVDIIDEVNEDLRRERLTRFWQRVGGYVIAVSVVIVVATVSTVLWQNYTASRQTEASEAFLAADKTLKAGDYDSAARQFGALAMKSAKGIPPMAAMKQAYALTKAGKEEKAQEIYLALAENRSVDKGMRSMARMYAAQIMAVRDRPLQDIATVLQPLTGDGNNPFRAIAREQLAYASLQHGDDATARRLLAELSSDMDAPVSLRRRAQAQAANMAVDGEEASVDTAAGE